MHTATQQCSGKHGILMAALVIGVSLGLARSAVGALSTYVNLGQAANYAILGIGGSSGNVSDFEVYQSGTYVLGNIGMGPYSQLTHGIDATINGNFNWDNNNTSTLNGNSTAGVMGGVQRINMSSVVVDARAASTTAAGLTPSQTFSTLTENQIINGVSGLNVIRISDPVTLKKGLTINGPSDATFVFQLTTSATGHILTLSGMTMTLTGGFQPGNLLWDLNGLGGDVVISSGAVVYGTFLAPDRQMLGDHAIIPTGRLIGGGSGTFLSVHSTSQVIVPEPASCLAALLLLLPLGASAVRILRKSS